MNYVTLGKTGIQASEIGFGSLVMSFSQLDLPEKDGVEIILHALSKGINLIDTAQFYRTYPVIRKALDAWKSNNPGQKDPIIVSKSLSGDYYEMMDAIYEARKSLGRDVIDIFLMHEVFGLDDLEARTPAKLALIDAKKDGLVKAIGVSTHHSDVAETVAASGDFDILFPLINVASMGIRRGDGFGTKEEMERAIQVAAANGMGVLGMKCFGGGPLLPRYCECLDYWWSIPDMHVKMLGFGSKEEVDRALSYLDGTLPDTYSPDMNQKELFIEETDCIGCGSCIKRCPNHAIHFSKKTGLAEVDRSLCMTCGYCAPVCPMRAIIMLTKQK